jgi:hypothetical protein
MPDDESNDNLEGKTVWVDWNGAAKDQSVRFADQMIVQNKEGMYYISFFAVNPPVIFGTSEEQAQQLSEVNKITPDCIGRIVVTEEFVGKMITALIGHISKVRSKVIHENDILQDDNTSNHKSRN